MFIRQFFSAAVVASSVIMLSACGGEKHAPQEDAGAESGEAAQVQETTTWRIGVCPGPYGKMIQDAIAPSLEKQNIKVEIVEFTDYVQPDLALDSGDLEANLMQHQAYLDGIVENQGLKLVSVINVPTLGLGVFSDTYTSFDQLKSGDKIAMPNDVVNLARALRIARDLGLITLKQDSDDNKASVGDIDTNKYEVEFVLMEAAQISRSLDSVAVGFVPGNYAIAASLDYSKALAIEDVKEDIKNVVAVREENKDTIGAKLREIVQSQDYRNAIEGNDYYKGFTRPAWWN